MPAQPQLTDQQIADVLTYVRNSFGNKASAITPAEVKAVRATTK
jgi:mono/diheme cytochrome c family protein